MPEPVSTISRTLTPAEAAEYLGVSERWVREHAQTRSLPFVRVGKFLRFRTADLDAYLEENAQPVVPDSSR